MNTSPDLTEELPWPKDLREGGAAFQKRVANPTMFRAYMLAKHTTLGITGAYLDVIEVTHARMILPDAFTTRDLFGRVATAAILSAAEMCSLSLLMLNLRNQKASHRPRLVHLSLDVIGDSEALKSMSFETDEGTSHGAFVARTAYDRASYAEATFTITARDALGEPTHLITLTWGLHEQGA